MTTKKRGPAKRKPKQRPGSKARALMRATDGVCAICKNPVNTDSRSKRFATVDHKVPKAKGGNNKPANLRLACRACNNKKGSRMPKKWKPGQLVCTTPSA